MNKPAYHVGGCLPPDASSYVVRSADEELYQQLLSGEFCYVLNSRQMGKSSLRVQTMKRLQQEGVVCASVDITELGTQQVTPEKWYGGLTKTLVTRLQLEEKFSYRNWLKEHKDIPPVQFFREFIEEVLLTKILGPIVIFIDEIDSVLQLSFKDDFFALIRACYNKRADNPAYNRISFVLLGVATPGDLIADKDRTPFNIGRAIELHGFQQHEVEPLAQGLSKYAVAYLKNQKFDDGQKFDDVDVGAKHLGDHSSLKPELYNPNASPSDGLGTLKPESYNPNASPSDGVKTHPSNPQTILKEILYWTGGQPFLTQKLCQLLVSESEKKHPRSVEQVVREQIISNWEASDEPEHLKTIRDRILSNEQRAAYLLELYQQVWQQGEVVTNNSFEEGKLQLSGLVFKQRVGSSPVLQVYNRIYYEVFNQDWIDKELALLRPYSEAFRGWVASGGEDESLLLRGNTLENAQAWAKGKNLSYQDQQFLAASEKKVIEEQLAASKLEAELERQRKDKEAAEKRNQVLAKANLVLTEAHRKAQQRIQIGAVVLTVAVLGAVVSGVFAGNKVTEANSKVKEVNAKVENANLLLAQAKKQALEEQQKTQQARDNLILVQGERENIKQKVQNLEKQKKQKSEELSRANTEFISLTKQKEQAHQESQQLAQQAQQATQKSQQLARQAKQATQETQQANQRLASAQQAFQQAATKAQQAQKKLGEAQERIKTADSRVQQLNQQSHKTNQELKQARNNLHFAKEKEKTAQVNLDRTKAQKQEIQQQLDVASIAQQQIEQENQIISQLSELAGHEGLSTDEADEVRRLVGASYEIKNNYKLKQAMIFAAISSVHQQLGQNFEAREQPDKSEKHWNKAQEALDNSIEILPSKADVGSILQESAIFIYVLTVKGNLLNKQGNTEGALAAYRQAFELLDTAWQKLPNVNDIKTEIPIPQYLLQQPTIFSANFIENLHKDFIVLLEETGKVHVQITKSLKRHYLAEVNFFMLSENWKDANASTFDLINFADWNSKNISCSDLHTIDRLWLERSEGMFGFSVQKAIVDEFTPKPDRYHNVDWDIFDEKTGRKNNENENKSNFNKVIRGYFPRKINSGGAFIRGSFRIPIFPWKKDSKGLEKGIVTGFVPVRYSEKEILSEFIFPQINKCKL
ncbi:MAG: hypothetical protein F6K41_00325 [Symploca sp. SIO3E6]|nr:hypothetical protein [Caldora sp. SIO3E6]